MKRLFALGLTLLFISQVLFSVHSDTINLQEPFDLIHWMIFIGLILILPYSLQFSEGIFQKIGGSITLISIVCTIGMCAFDFIFWTLRNNLEARNELLDHLMSEPFIWSVFITVGPACFFIGFAIQALGFLRKNRLGSVSTLLGSFIVGLGHFIFQDIRVIYLLGYFIFVSGILIITFNRFSLPKKVIV